jgi:uncharacterized protein DUF5670
VAVSAIVQTPRRAFDTLQLSSAPLDVELEAIMLMTILVVLGILWLLGFSLNVGGGLIHLLLVVAVVLFLVNMLSGRRGLA